MLAPLALCTAAVMATSCSRSLFVAGPTRLLMKRQRQQHQPLQSVVMILDRTASSISMLVAPHHHQRHQQRQPLLPHHHRLAASGLPSAPLRSTARTGGSKTTSVAASAAAAAAEAAAAVGFSGGGANPVVGSSSLAVLLSTQGVNSDSDDLERCRRLAQNLGVALLVDGEKDWGGREGERGEGGAGAETNGFRFTLSFDETGRLALGQPGSGFKPLAVDFSGGKTGHRAKNQKGTEQVVKAAALPKRRAGAAAASAAAPAAAAHPASSGGGGGGVGGGVGGAVNGRQTPSDGSWSSDGEGGGGGGSEEGCGDVEEGLPLLWDLTAGLGTDSFVLALAGWRVEMFERSAVVAALVQDALDRARAGDDETARVAASRMSLVVADSTDACAEQAVAGQGQEGGDTATRRPAVVYLDPMFPQRKKSALVKKGMQMLQALLEEGGEGRATQQGHGGDGCGGGDGGEGGGGGGDGVSDSVRDGGGGGGGGGSGERGREERRLFDAAMSVATRKVVVKRPVHGAAIVEHVAPSHAVVSKNGRFDVYVVK